MSRSEHLVSASDLPRELDSVIVLDVRWRLGDLPGAGRERYVAGHLPGARHLDLEQVLTGPTDDPRAGRHPLPEVERLERGLAALGVDTTDEVVVYDEPGSFAAARAWWVLRWARIRTRVLDGGLPAWVAAGGQLQHGDEVTWPTTAPTLTTGHLSCLSADEAAAYPDHGVLVDVRAPERFRGEMEPLDPRAGHIPGAVNLPAVRLLTESGALPGPEELRRAFAGLAGPRVGTSGPTSSGPTPSGGVAAYCGSGVTAAQAVLALATLDVEAALFAGSWSAWSNDPDRPVATGG